MERERHFLLVCNDLATTHIALFKAVDSCPLQGHIAVENKRASALLIPQIDALLLAAGVPLQDLLFVAACCGPAPFTTLRTVLATVNGLGAATRLPLVGIDCFKAFFDELRRDYPLQSGYHIILQNAFCNDFYFASQDAQTGKITQLTAPLDQVLLRITELGGEPIVLAGNAVTTPEAALLGLALPRLLIPTPVKTFPSLETFGAYAWSQWKAGYREQLLTPLYLKNPVVYTNE